MYLYNITVSLDETVHQEWKDWVLNQLLLRIMQYKLFENNRVFRLLNDGAQYEITYSLQFFTDNPHDIAVFRDEYEKTLMSEFVEKYQGKLLYFATILKEQISE